MRTALSPVVSAAFARLSVASALIAASMAAQALVPLQNIAKIAAGDLHSCAVTTGGGVKCWGDNASGQLGDNSSTRRLIPVDVVGLASGVADIAAGSVHTCALTTLGGVKCWGDNGDGQLGNNSTAQSLTPTDVAGLASGVTAIAAGSLHTCALTTGGGVKCWGSNGFGQLGDNTTAQSLIPLDVTGLGSGIAAISAGDQHSCALTTLGGVKCWGYNFYGQLGDNSTTDRHTPADVSGLSSGVAAIAAGSFHGCALTTVGGVQCWGYNGTGQVGDNSLAQRNAPVDVFGLASGVATIAAGARHTCVITTVGGAKCWGDNTSGQLGDDSLDTRPAAVDVTGLASGVAAIATGTEHTCALDTGGGVKCWGSDGSGQLGDDFATLRVIPVGVSGLASGAAAVAAGGNHTCAVTTGGGAKCWGWNVWGQVGDNSTTQRLAPVDVFGLASGTTAITAGDNHSCALNTGGAKCWGQDAFGQLGDNSTTNSSIPVDVFGLTSGMAAVAAAPVHTCALTAGGGVKCWGGNSNGQLGNNSTTQRLTPVNVSGLSSGVTAIATGTLHSCALTTLGAVKCWGDNAYGQLGDNSGTDSPIPVDVLGLASGVTAVKASGYHTCALTAGGGIKCWGANVWGELGDNSTFNRPTPVDVLGLTSGVAAIAAGAFHTCAVTLGGGVKCWGRNEYGQLGDNSTTYRIVPVDVSGFASGAAAIAAGQSHTCALTTLGGVKCWGVSLNGQIGDGTGSARPYPSDVLTMTPPSAPAIGTATPGNASATVSFTPPASDGGSPITSYTVTCNPGGLFASGTASPLTVTGLTNATLYSCSATATNAVGPGAASATVDVTPVGPPFALTAVQSRKTHGAAGAFDIAIDTAQPIGGTITVDSRAIGAGHAIVFQFNGPVTFTGIAASVDAGAIPTGTAAPAVSGNDVVVTLTGIPDNQRVTVSLTNVNGAGVDAAASIGFLVGDVNNSRSVTATDIVAVKARSGQLTSAANFKFDLNASGSVTATDILAVKGRSGFVLP